MIKKILYFLFSFLFFSLHGQVDTNNNTVDLVIFSYDRPLQLHAYLESIERFVTGLQQTHIIYRTSSSQFEEAYKKVKATFPWATFYKQRTRNDFKKLVLTTCFKKSSSKYLMFGVDDIIVTDFVNLTECAQLIDQHQAFGFYLRNGKNITHCYMCSVGKNGFALPPLTQISPDAYQWNFDQGKCSWSLATSVDMVLFKKQEIQKTLESLAFDNPGRLEFRWRTQSNNEQTTGLCYEYSKIVNIPLNLVGTFEDNHHMNFASPEELLDLYNTGHHINSTPLFQIKNQAPHHEYIPEFIKVEETRSVQKSLPRVLLLHFKTKYWGGMENHTLNRYKMLLKHGYDANILVYAGTKMEEILKQLGLPYKLFTEKHSYEDIARVCKELATDIVMCPGTPTIQATKKAAQKLSKPLKIIGVRHMPVTGSYKIDLKLWHSVDGIIGVSPEITNYFKNTQTSSKRKINNIVYIPPFFEEEKFRIFSTTESRDTYFKRNFNLDVGNLSVICMIANMYDNALHKNHPLLLQAVQILTNKNKPVHVMLAGDGVRRHYLEKLARDMGISKYVHFLGFTNDIPALLHHTDIHVLTSSEEAFGQAHIEAALMKKPSIGATETGATAIIIHEHTGLLFKNGDVNDLVLQLEKLLDNKNYALRMGGYAYEHALTNFANEIQFAKLETLFEVVMES